MSARKNKKKAPPATDADSSSQQPSGSSTGGNRGGDRLSEAMQACATLLREIQEKPEADAFLEPVDWERYGLTDYPEIIKKPMDLGTIQNKLESGRYAGPEKFAGDVRLVWRNAMTYNRQDSDIYRTADSLAKLFDKKFSRIKKSPASSSSSTAPSPSSSASTPNTTPATPASEKKRKAASASSTVTTTTPDKSSDSSAPTGSSANNPNPAGSSQSSGPGAPGGPGGSGAAGGGNNPPVGGSRDDKVKFSKLVTHLDDDQLGHVVSIVQQTCPHALTEQEQDVIEIEINVLDAHTLSNLLAYAHSCISENGPKNKTQKKKQRAVES